MTDYTELRTLATAALTHRHTERCYRNGSGPWCVFEPTNIDHWTVLLGLLDKLEALEKLVVDSIAATWTAADFAEYHRLTANPTEAKDG